jgi:hypothetical protein
MQPSSATTAGLKTVENAGRTNPRWLSLLDGRKRYIDRSLPGSGASTGYHGSGNGWRYPFQQWVLDGWRAHCEAIGADVIAEAFRRNLTNPNIRKFRK